jgi:fumarate hydratase class II
VEHRLESDSLGEVAVPSWALWGASTQRAVDNFKVSGKRLPPVFIRALGAVKAAAARANTELGLLSAELGAAIERAAQEVSNGGLLEHFVVDIFQTGSGTSTNMNANEVIANRALELLGRERGERATIHPNDHVNLSQSSNDVFPTAIHLAAYRELHEETIPALTELYTTVCSKSSEFAAVIKGGRTHLQDALPLTVGQEWSGYATQLRLGLSRIQFAGEELLELALGGTAVGTGASAPSEFAARALAHLRAQTGYPLRETRNHFAAQAALDSAVALSGQLRTVAVSLLKIADDLRWAASGPNCGLSEISLPVLQPGSSIMPGKSNPVICESVMMVCAQVLGNDSTIVISGERGNFELNTMMPVLAYNLLESLGLVAAAARNFSRLCISGVTVNAQRCLAYAEGSAALVTALVPALGYDTAAEVARRSLAEGRPIREIALDLKLLSPEQLKTLFEPRSVPPQLTSNQ